MITRQDVVFYKTDHTVLRILIKFSCHSPDFSSTQTEQHLGQFTKN